MVWANGLGPSLMTGMVVSAALYYPITTGAPDAAGGPVGPAMVVDLAFLTRACLIAHAGFAAVAHFTRAMSFSTMGTFKGIDR